jgi:hypothetical protein
MLFKMTSNGTANIVKKTNARMELLRKVASFGTSEGELKNIYILYVRSLLEQSCTVGHCALTDENELERVQKSAMKVILQEKYNGYKNALNKLDLESLSERREQLCVNFAQKCVNLIFLNIFPLNNKYHNMHIRNTDKYHLASIGDGLHLRLQSFQLKLEV